MIKEHTHVSQEVAALSKKLKMSPGDSDMTKTLKEDATKNSATQKSVNGGDFEKAYVALQVADHEKVLTTIDNILLPNAKDADVRQLTAKVHPAVSAHLDHAKSMQAAMK